MLFMPWWAWGLPAIAAAALAIIITVLVMDHRHEAALDAEFDQGWDMCAASITAQLGADGGWDGPASRPGRGRHEAQRRPAAEPPPPDGTDWRPMRAYLIREWQRITQGGPRRPPGTPAAPLTVSWGRW